MQSGWPEEGLFSSMLLVYYLFLARGLIFSIFLDTGDRSVAAGQCEARPGPGRPWPGLCWPGQREARPGKFTSFGPRPGHRPDICIFNRPGHNRAWPGPAHSLKSLGYSAKIWYFGHIK